LYEESLSSGSGGNSLASLATGLVEVDNAEVVDVVEFRALNLSKNCCFSSHSVTAGLNFSTETGFEEEEEEVVFDLAADFDFLGFVGSFGKAAAFFNSF